MNNYHVESLSYKLKLSEDLNFKNPLRYELAFNEFTLKLEDGELTIQMIKSFPNEKLAREVVEAILKNWELEVYLKEGGKKFWFEFMNSKIIDIGIPDNNGSAIVQLETQLISLNQISMSAIITKKEYPRFEGKLLMSPDVESLIYRYDGYLNGREPLLGMAYFCLSLLQNIAGNRTKLARIYKIDCAVLDKLGKISSEHGDKSEARKLDRNATNKSITFIQKNWILETLKALIKRKAEYDKDSEFNYSIINFDSLPKYE